MKRLLPLFALTSLFALLAFGEDFSGKLIDASCYSQQKKVAGCHATAKTSSFALDIAGKVFILDTNGNTKAASAMSSRADRATDPNNPASQDVVAKVSGTQSAGTIAVETIEVQ
jgi:hypothetical protein